MGKNMKKTLSLVMAGALILGISTPDVDAAAKMKLSEKKVTINVGEKTVLKVKKAKKKAKWSVKSGKKVIALSKKKKASVTITGKKAGKAVVQAKIGKKKLTCKVTVKKAVPNDTVATPSVAPTTTPVASVAPTASAPAASASASVAPTASAPATTAPATEAPVVLPEGDLTFDLTGVQTTFTEDDWANDKMFIDLRPQFGTSLEISNYARLEVTYTTKWTDDELQSGWAIGKLAIAGSEADLTGKADGIAFNYNLAAAGGTTSLSLGASTPGIAYGLNFQPMMNGDNKYAWPVGLESMTITKVQFIAPTEAPVTPLPSTEFTYEGLDMEWIEANIDPSKPVVAMTFDDGPGGYSGFVDYGMQIQEALKEAGAHATFFYVGSSILKDEDHTNEVKQAVENGFEVANHSWDFSELHNSSAEEVQKKWEDTNAALKEVTGYSNFLFRAPGVKYSDTMFATINAPFIDVSAWSNDWNESSTKEGIIENVCGAKDGDIINMHSVHKKTAQAVPEILAYFKEQGIQVVSVSELYAIRGEKLMTGVKYSKCPAAN